MVERIKQILEYYKLSPASFAEQIGINRSNLTHLFSGRNQPSLDLAKKILHCYPDIKTEWLIMGVGEMFCSNEDRKLQIQIQSEKMTQYEPEEVDLFSSIPTSARKATSLESRVEEQNKINEQISNSREIEIPPTVATEKHIINESLPSHSTVQVNKIVFFYSDSSFEIYYQNKT